MVDQAVVRAPENLEVLDLAGQVQLAAGERNRALATFSKLVNLQPNSAVAQYRLATAQLAAGDAVSATSSLRRAVALQPDLTEAQILLAETDARNGREDEALKTASRLQLQKSNSPVGWVVEGDIHMLRNQPRAAVKAYEKAYGLARTGAVAIKLHSALERDGRGAEGEARLREWLKQEPNDVTARLYLGEAYLRSSNCSRAIEEYEYLAKGSSSVVVLNNLAWCYLQVNDKRAVETAEMALRLSPENPAVIDTLGWILVESGNMQKGLPLLRKAAALAPKAPDIRFHLAQGLMRSGDKSAARAELERVLVEFPKFSQHDVAMKLLAELR